MEIKKPLHRPEKGSCAWNEHVLCSSYPPSIWRRCDDIPPRCRGCGWNPAVSAVRAEKIREVVINGKTA